MRLLKIAINLHQIGSKTAARHLFRVASVYDDGFSFDTITEQIYKELADPKLKDRIRQAVLGANLDKIVEDDSVLDPARELASLGSLFDMLPEDEAMLVFRLLKENRRIDRIVLKQLGLFIEQVANEFDLISEDLREQKEYALATEIDKIYRGIFALGKRLQQQ